MLGGKPGISTQTEHWVWLCTPWPFEEQLNCSLKVHGPSGILTHVVWKWKMTFLSTGSFSKEHEGQLHSAVCSYFSKSQWFPRASSCVTALLLLLLEYYWRERKHLTQRMWYYKCHCSEIAYVKAHFLGRELWFYISNQNFSVFLCWFGLI